MRGGTWVYKRASETPVAPQLLSRWFIVIVVWSRSLRSELAFWPSYSRRFVGSSSARHHHHHHLPLLHWKQNPNSVTRSLLSSDRNIHPVKTDNHHPVDHQKFIRELQQQQKLEQDSDKQASLFNRVKEFASEDSKRISLSDRLITSSTKLINRKSINKKCTMTIIAENPAENACVTSNNSDNIVSNNNIINNNSNNNNNDINIHGAVSVIEKLRGEIIKEIFCGGTLLEAVQKSKLFGDCKHFVDMPLKTDPASILSDWHILLSSGHIDEGALKRFVEANFDEPGGELDLFQPSDFDPEGGKFEAITCPNYRKWAKELHRKWPTLCRKVSDRVLADPDRFSLISLPKPFVVPGGRFREMYYWDSFFTIKGLLASGMYETVRGMIENIGSLIERFGYVPNGNRVYYLNRSQPPLLTWCLSSYYEATGDKQFVISAVRWFERELEFFQKHRSIQLPGVASPLYRYHVISAGPRPESYREDVESATHIEDLVGKQRLWGDIAAAAESGRDFSSRWFSHDGPAAGKMGSTRTSSILPVDLNAIICGNMRLMANLYEVIGAETNADYCRIQFNLMKRAIHEIFWSEEHGCWFDYDIVHGCHVNAYMDTNFFPLFTGCTHDGFDAVAVARYLSNSGVLSFPGGLPSSLIASGQQWDFPNAWAPTTWVVIQGLRASGQYELARQIAEKWIRRNYDTWITSGGQMFEKYNVASQCYNSAGGGGEYEVQEGFGWTNGVVLDLLLVYASDLMFKPDVDLQSTANTGAAKFEKEEKPDSNPATSDTENECVTIGHH